MCSLSPGSDTGGGDAALSADDGADSAENLLCGVRTEERGRQPGGRLGYAASRLGGSAHVPETSLVLDAQGALTGVTQVTIADLRVSLLSAQGGATWLSHQLGFGLQLCPGSTHVQAVSPESRTGAVKLPCRGSWLS